MTQMQIAFLVAQTQKGVKEIVGPKHNPTVVEYAQSCTLQANDDETPWCSEFVNWCYIIAGLILNNGRMTELLRQARYEGRDIDMFQSSTLDVLKKITGLPVRTGDANVKLPTRSALARSWIAFGTRTKSPKRGDIVVFSRGNNGLSGHVAFVDSIGWTYVQSLGGNQSNAVNVAPYSRARVLAYITEG